jgi:tetratricopeptide (TPR) repeat protein
MRIGMLLLMIAASGLAVGCRGRDRSRGASAVPAVATMRSDLAPDPAVVRYKLSTLPDPDSDISSIIKQLEERASTPIVSAEDLGELGALYVKRAQREGDVDDYRRGEEMAKRSLAMRATRNGARMILAQTANARHDFRQAIEIAREALKDKPTPGAYDLLASAHLALGELPEAIEAADAAVAIGSSTATLLMRALVLQAQGRDAEAAFDFARAVVVEERGDLEEAARTRALWGRFLIRRGELPGAVLVVDEALRIIPGDPLALAQKAEIALRSGTLKEARTMFEQAFSSSRQVRYLIDLSRAQELAGDRAGADSSRAQVEKIVRAEVAENGFGHQLDLVEILVDRGTSADLAEAVKLANEEVVRRPSADTRFQLARALWRSGAVADAATQVHAALASGARDARLYELAARVEGGIRGTLYAREAQKLDPGNSGWRGLGMGR